MGEGRKLFGTDGVRGVANLDPVTGEVAMALGRAAGFLLFERTRRVAGRPPTVVIGKDTRLSGYMLENALAAGFCSVGAQVYFVGPLPTPGVAFLVRNMRADAGVVVSASHNGYQDNGIKLFDAEGCKLKPEDERALEQLIGSKMLEQFRATGDAIGRAKRIDDAIGRYIVAVKSAFPSQLTLEGLRIVVDCANGAAYRVAPTVLEELGAEVFPIHCEPDGSNINDACGSTHPQSVVTATHRHRAEVGIALDGDADRVVLCDERGEIVDGDAILAICATHLLEKKALPHGTVVATPMSNLGLHRAIERAGGRLEITPVGDRFVVEKMREKGYALGGEKSGHVIFSKHSTTGDGLLAALQVLALMKSTGKPLSELRKVFSPFPQILKNVAVERRVPLEDLADVKNAVRAAEKALGPDGRVYVRYSGTESVVRVMVEGANIDQLRKHADTIAEAIQKALILR